MIGTDSTQTVQNFILSSGKAADLRWDFPNPEGFGQGPHPLVFLNPSSEMRDVSGNGPAYPVHNSLRDLSKALTADGFATFRFAVPEPLELHDMLELYQRSLQTPSVDYRHATLLGMVDGADPIARTYYNFYAVNPPWAAVLISPRVQTIHLNNLTCPYLVLHGDQDSFVKDLPYGKVEEAVRHHQMRYGDPTTHLLLPHLGKELGVATFDHRVMQQIVDWLHDLVREGRFGNYGQVA